MKVAAHHYRTGLIAFLLFIYCSPLQAQLNVTIQLKPYCNDFSPAQVCAVATGGTSPYFYQWSDGRTQGCIPPHPYYAFPRTYAVTVTDNAGATGTASVAIDASHNPGVVVQVQAGIQHETCSDNDGSAWISNITGGAAPYSICWSDGQAPCFSQNDSIFNLSSENYYMLEVIDSNGCMGIDTALGTDSLGRGILIDINRNLPYTYTLNTTNYDCGIPGTARVDVAGGSPPFTYQWSTIPVQTTDSVGGLFGGYYTVTISDNTAGCSITESFYINNLNPLFSNVSSTDETCDDANGTAAATPSSGTPPFTFLWSTTPVQTAYTATNLTTGYYYVTFVDANQCSGRNAVYVGNASPVQHNAVAVHEVCGDSSGSITLSPLLGTPPYAVQWSNGGTGNAITDLQQGYYTFTVTDAAGCAAIGGKYIDDVPAFTVDLSYTPETCSAPGTATATVTGTTGPYTYHWSTTPPQTTQTATGLTFGLYYCTITDANNCSTSDYVYVLYNPAVNATLSASPALCLSASGSISCTVTGGAAPYTFRWSNGSTAQDLTGVPAGNYRATITDANNCTVTKAANVLTSSNMGITISTVNALCVYTHDGQATVSVTNATPPITYRWGNGQTTPTATGLTGGWQYGILVTDANGCFASECVNIGFDNLSCAAEISGKVLHDVDANCTFSGGDRGVYQIPVSTSSGSYSLTSATGDYTLYVPAGDQAVSHRVPYHMFQLCPANVVDLPGLTGGDDTLVNFYDTVRTALDLSVGYGYVTPPRPGYQHRVVLNCANKGNLTGNATVEYEYDTLVSLIFANRAFLSHDIANRKVVFSLLNFAPGEREWVEMTFSTPATAALDTRIRECATILPVVNDVHFTDNVRCDSTEVVGSFDPNDKAVSPRGAKVPGNNGFYITREDSVLHYKIRFQNTGTYPAEQVAILDTLDGNVLDISSVHGITASHEYRADFFLNKYLAFYFDNINLPDSTHDEPESHGFVSFYIKQKPSLDNRTQINNRAAIYFDYNEPVITNTVTLVLAEPTGVTYLAQNNTLVAYPNPTDNLLFFKMQDGRETVRQIEVYDLSGKLCAEAQDNQISLRKIPAGMYFFRVLGTSGKTYTGKVVKRD